MFTYLRKEPPQAVRMLCAWAGALVMLPVIYRTAVAGVLASPSLRLPILFGLVIAVAATIRAIFKRAQPGWMSLPICVVLGAMFTSISVSLTLLCAGLFA